MIEVCSLGKRFGTRPAVDDISVTFPAGTVTALLGLNGAGKTTLLRLIAGLERPDRGTVTLAGPLGVHIDPAGLDPRHTVWRHLTWRAALTGLPTDAVRAALTQARMFDHRHRRIADLSLGARQRLAIAGALLGDPDALIFDEPLNGLDVPGILWFRDLLRCLADDGRCVVLATHLLGEVVHTADRATILRDGRIAFSGSLADLVPGDTDRQRWLEQTLMAAA
ncbi:multidrug ABC transporter ATP-binding protein [Mycolicibacterium duvalii]|uniref:Multidrug ABC transporter ATP-binding protein n=1 Tax=Mycolicibacterium duvalii TaxID=39688 RepID=A0A7I7JX90_9MYCO|nr:ABC transporter ATP-binding protein [Mycolicibacterium duvalii]MCV7369985.1 ABC transporter ATP-binding protein [Mycolicibacterium duvalii]PEG34860.1 multidrug ABC transporter ATP-binding protein [Mycolicibacterium duvalii]BBX15914.1 multidrug ABC transporter ATP-binding protein [Mycolicibacterium duvalii]